MASKFAKQTNETIDIVWKGDAGINEREDRLGRSWFNLMKVSILCGKMMQASMKGETVRVKVSLS